MKTNSCKSIDEYTDSFPFKIRQILQRIRTIVKKEAPDATEVIKYQMPTFVLGKNLLHFAAYKNHIGFYPTPSAIVKFKNKLKKYKISKGAIQFPVDKSMPYNLIKEITKYRVESLKTRNM